MPRPSSTELNSFPVVLIVESCSVSTGARAAISHWWLRNEPPNAPWKNLSAMTYLGAPLLCR